MGITLAKGQTINLAKADGTGLTAIHMGTGWDAARTVFGRTRAIDLDASALLFGADRGLIDQVWFRQLTSRDNAVRHTGDNRTGLGDGDDESIIVDLTAVNPAVSDIVFVVNSFSGETFSKVSNAYCRLVDLTTNVELARYSLSQSGPHTAQVMAKVSRRGGAWTMTAIGLACNGRTFKDLVPAVVPLLGG